MVNCSACQSPGTAGVEIRIVVFSATAGCAAIISGAKPSAKAAKSRLRRQKVEDFIVSLLKPVPGVIESVYVVSCLTDTARMMPSTTSRFKGKISLADY